ncbi:hypothetical protein CEXT_118951 [Caerostris extrusa]|uniref:Uncharacterized protein n=1 Tax=Caerostris extrusa TaxID=172846 RepID=A0AAV4Y1M9_CAEEX|nr:hypothetical protein CEXT_118951 [Caerostris extrusa]
MVNTESTRTEPSLDNQKSPHQITNEIQSLPQVFVSKQRSSSILFTFKTPTSMYIYNPLQTTYCTPALSPSIERWYQGGDRTRFILLSITGGGLEDGKDIVCLLNGWGFEWMSRFVVPRR